MKMSKFEDYIQDERMYFACCDSCDNRIDPQTFSSEVDDELERLGWDVIDGKLKCKWCQSDGPKKLAEAAKKHFANQP